MSYCRRVVVLTFIFHDGRCVTNGHLSAHIPWGEVKGVSLMVNSYADIYKPNRQNHLRQNKEIGIIPVAMEAVVHQVISVGVCAHERNDDCRI